MFESKYGLYEDVPGAEQVEEELDKALNVFLTRLLEIEKMYPEAGLSDTDVREAVLQEIVNRFP